MIKDKNGGIFTHPLKKNINRFFNVVEKVIFIEKWNRLQICEPFLQRSETFVNRFNKDQKRLWTVSTKIID